MSTVSYKRQPGIHKTRGSIPLAGTSHVYTVGGILWPSAVEEWIQSRLVGYTLHICCGKSLLGDVRLDLFEQGVDVRADAARLPFPDDAFDCVLADPPYSGVFRWNHDMLNELHRVAGRRIIFQHHFSPVDKKGFFKKNHAFVLTDVAVVPEMPKSMAKEIRLAVKTDNGYVVVDDTPEDEKMFYLADLAYWSPKTYFGRVQLISILDRVGVSKEDHNWVQLSLPLKD
jgi:hypothetical protein